MIAKLRGVGLVDDAGFSVHAGIISVLEAVALRDRLSGVSRSRAGARHLMKHPDAAAIAIDPRMLSLARDVLGATALPYRATLFDKSAASNWLVTWHQDTALPIRSRKDLEGWGPWSIKAGVNYAQAPAAALEQIVALRLHLDDSTVENGPLRVIADSHRKGVLTDADISSLAANESAVDCLVRIGGVIRMRPLIVHASSKATNGQPRRVLHIEYASSLLLVGNLELAIA